MDEFRLEIYDHSHAEAVAAMWTESRDGWPPGFLGASEFTASGIEMEEDASGKLFTILALQNNRVVGYCRTTPYGGEPDAAYVALLNVVPDLHGKKLGKRLLLDAVSRTAEAGYFRVDLHTWPSNLKAMPLYKKTGFFWVPDSMVYMQNYMPFLLSRREFRDFLKGDDWYGHFVRELKVEHDEQRTPSGREIFQYRFERNGEEFLAEFDRRGRILSRLECSARSILMEREKGRIFTGRKLKVSIRGRNLPDRLKLESHDHLVVQDLADKIDGGFEFSVEHQAVDVPVNEYDRSPRVTADIFKDDPLKIGIGIRAEEPVSIISSSVRWLPPEANELTLDIRRVADVKSIDLKLDLDGEDVPMKPLKLDKCVFQRVTIPLPVNDTGVHELSVIPVSDGIPGAQERIILISGVFSGPPRAFATRRSGVILGPESVLEVHRDGGQGALRVRNSRTGLNTRGWSFITAGPPFWNSDLRHQTYSLKIGKSSIQASTLWPSRPGLGFSLKYRLDDSGTAQVQAGVKNGSNTAQAVTFAATWGGTGELRAERSVLPLREGTVSAKIEEGQVPDHGEDYPRKAEEFSSPWMAVSGRGGTIICGFDGWKRLQYGMPETEELEILPEEEAHSPVLRVYYAGDGLEQALQKGESRGLIHCGRSPLYDFVQHNVQPVMAAGSPITLSHRFLGKRQGAIVVGSRELACGTINRDSGITALVPEVEKAEISLSVAGRSRVYPVRILSSGADKPTLDENENILEICNGRMKALIDPSEFGHVYSLKLDGTEYLLSSHPGPGEFAWEKPWFGGILPGIRGLSRSNPYHLDRLECSRERFQREIGGVSESGWKLGWIVDHKKFGSYRLIWRVSMLPAVPVLNTSLEVEALKGAYPGGRAMLRGFLSPAGKVDDVVHTTPCHPRLRQGRKHSGTWLRAEPGGRIHDGEGRFVQAYSRGEGIMESADYADLGCHFICVTPIGGKTRLAVTWVLGDGAGDESLVRVFDAHMGDSRS